MAIITLSWPKGRWRWFILFLLVTICTEAVGWYLRTIEQSRHFRLPFTILLIIRICFFLWFFSGSVLLERFRKIFKQAILIFLIFSIINLIFIQGLRTYNFYSEVLGDIFLVIACCAFYYELLMEKRSTKLLTYPYFWLSTGFLLSALGSIVLYIFMEAIIAYYEQTKINIGGNINTVLSVILYGNLIIAFICQRRLNLSLASS